MQAKHMDLLDQWRLEVVREGKRFVEKRPDLEMSLTKTCLKCHTSKAQFCDKCHNYAAVAPTCWDCHIIPKENQ